MNDLLDALTSALNSLTDLDVANFYWGEEYEVFAVFDDGFYSLYHNGDPIIKDAIAVVSCPGCIGHITDEDIEHATKHLRDMLTNDFNIRQQRK